MNSKTILNKVNRILADTAKTRSGKVPKENKIEYIKLNEKILRNLLNTDYSEAYERYKHGCCMFRGVSDRTKKRIGKYKVLKPGLRVTSADTSDNLYTRLLSGILPSWRKFPPRNRSFTCSTSSGYALSYTNNESSIDNVYVVLPKNGANIGVCPRVDIWESFEILNENDISLDDFQYILFDVIELIGEQLNEIITDKNKKKTTKYSNMRDILDNATKFRSDRSVITILNSLSEKLQIYIDEIIERLKNKYEIKDMNKFFISMYIARTTVSMLQEMKRLNTVDIIKFLDTILNPKKNGFKTVSIKNYKEKALILRVARDSGKEVWTDSECLFVSMLFLESLQ